MGRRPIKSRAMTGAERVAEHAKRLRDAGGRRVTVTLDAKQARALDAVKQRARELGYRIETDAGALAWLLAAF